MESIRINTGAIRLCINDDPERVIEFNPRDVNFAERFYALIREFDTALVKYQARAREIDSQTEVDEHGIAVNVPERLSFAREIGEFFREKIDMLFGAGTSQTVFGDAVVMETFQQFFENVTPFIQRAREEKLVKYATDKLAGRVMK